MKDFFRSKTFKIIAVLLAAVLGGGSIWFAPVISEVLCLGLSVFFLLQLRRTHPVFAKGKPA